MTIRKRNHQSGIAMLIVILALLLVTAVAAGMMIFSTSEVKVDANYRDEQVALFAAKAGLEEARDRMLVNNANFITNLPTVVPSNGCSGCATYIVSSNTIQPWSSSSPKMYGAPTFDSEFLCEFDSGCTGSFTGTSTLTNASYSGPATDPIPYQWVRINLKTNETIDSSTGNPHWVNSALTALPGAQVMFDSNPAVGPPHECVTGYCPPGDTVQPVYEVTSYAVTPSGTIRTLQDDIAAFTFNLHFPSSLTLPGPIGSFNPPNSKGYCMSGNDTSQAGPGGSCSYTPPPSVPGCTTSAAPEPAVGVTQGNTWDSSTSNQNYVTSQINNTGRQANYTGSTGSTPSVSNVSLPSNLSNPTELLKELSAIQQNADVCLGCSTSGGGGSYTFSNLDTAPGSLWGSCGTNCGTTPQVTYVNGNLDISGSNTGSGILVVTGNLTYDGNSSWNGIILVVGNGMTTYEQNGSGNGQFNGAIFVADITNSGCAADQTHCYGPSDFTINGGGGNGIYYNSCWVNHVQRAVSYTVLSSNEISQ